MREKTERALYPNRAKLAASGYRKSAIITALYKLCAVHMPGKQPAINPLNLLSIYNSLLTVSNMRPAQLPGPVTAQRQPFRDRALLLIAYSYKAFQKSA
jgi:hypothetical protein